LARPRRDGTPPRETNRRKLTDLFVTSRKGGTRDELIWDVRQPGLALSVRTTGKKAWKVVYRFHGRPRWLHLGDIRSIGLADARRHAAKTVLDVLDGKDPVAQLQAARNQGSFAELAADYVKLHARRHNKSWQATEKLVARYLLSRWGKIKASAITRTDVRAVMARMSEAPITANQVLASASAIF
jgi:Arm DNA-binding domain